MKPSRVALYPCAILCSTDNIKYTNQYDYVILTSMIMTHITEHTIDWNKEIEKAKQLKPLEVNVSEAEIAARRMRVDKFISTLSERERKSLEKAQGIDDMLKAIFRFDSPDKIREALTLAASGGSREANDNRMAVSGPEASSPLTPRVPEGTKRSIV
jgi:hypothetical protein